MTEAELAEIEQRLLEEQGREYDRYRAGHRAYLQDIPVLITAVRSQGAVLAAAQTRLTELESYRARVQVTEAGQGVDTVDAAYQRGWDDAGFIKAEWEQRLTDLRAVVDELRAERKRGAGLGLGLCRLLDALERSEG